MFDFSIVTNWIHQMLTSLMPEGLAVFLECVVIGVCIILMYAVLAIILIYMERKICAFFQCRLGPMRVGKWGLLLSAVRRYQDVDQGNHRPEVLRPIPLQPGAVHGHHSLVPHLRLPACQQRPGSAGLQRGRVLLLAASSIGVVGILLAGWSSNNKFSLIGAMRSGAQIISYELSCGLSILTMVVLMGTMQFSEIVAGQADGWFIFKGHIPALIAFIIYLIAGNAETNRGPFDCPRPKAS